MTKVKMKPPKDINFVLVECNSFLKSPRKIKGCLIMVYIQEHNPDSEDIIRDSQVPWLASTETLDHR